MFGRDRTAVVHAPTAMIARTSRSEWPTVAIGLLAIRPYATACRYELWYYLHLTSYLVLLLGYGHQFTDGQEFSKGGFGHWYWVSLSR